MKINFTIDATVKEMNTMINPTELELPEILLEKIVAAVKEVDRIFSAEEGTEDEHYPGDRA